MSTPRSLQPLHSAAGCHLPRQDAQCSRGCCNDAPHRMLWVQERCNIANEAVTDTGDPLQLQLDTIKFGDVQH